MTDIKNHAAFIWSVADLLRGDYRQSEYGKVILPFTVLRRLDCVLDPVKADMLARDRGVTFGWCGADPVGEFHDALDDSDRGVAEAGGGCLAVFVPAGLRDDLLDVAIGDGTTGAFFSEQVIAALATPPLHPPRDRRRSPSHLKAHSNKRQPFHQ